MSIPSRSPSRSSMITCNCNCTSSFLLTWSFLSSTRLVSFCRSVSSASAMVRMRSSRDWTFTSHFCFSACNNMISSVIFAATPSTASAWRSFVRFTSCSMVSRLFSTSKSCCWSLFTSCDKDNLALVRLALSSVILSSSAFTCASGELASAFSARISSPDRNVSTWRRSSITRPSASAATRWRSSSCAVRSSSAARSWRTCCFSSASFSSCRLRICTSSSSFSCMSRKLRSSSRVGEALPLSCLGSPLSACFSRTCWMQRVIACNTESTSETLHAWDFACCTPFATGAPPPGAPPGCLCRAPATARSCRSFRVLGTSFPFSTSPGSKSTERSPRAAATVLDMYWRSSILPSRGSGQSSDNVSRKPVACAMSSPTSCTNFGGGRARSS
mmetsp:Transcript_79834/g.237841  ORF Transcript_79834/g.237841 Transcript_79834/m.237841 type:complete len:387 (+) Transcript_79834:380-1540(+)